MSEVLKIVIVDADAGSRRLLADLFGREGLREHVSVLSPSDERPDVPVLWIDGAKTSTPESFSRPLRWGAVLDRVRRHLEAKDVTAREAFGAYTLDMAESLLSDNRNGRSTRLTDKERDLLLLLIKAGDGGAGRQDLLHQAWGYADNVETHTLETHVYRLRQKLIAAGFPAELIIKTEDGYKIDLMAI